MRSSAIIPLLLLLSCAAKDDKTGQTEITKWQFGKKAAVSITLDDASINQFRQALPIMDTLGIKATFFIIMAEIQKSTIQPKFLGRPMATIVKETATIPTNKENLFERASAIRFTGIKEAVESHNNAGSLFESGKVDEAYKVIDQAYKKVRTENAIEKKLKDHSDRMITWPEVKSYAANGHEFGSHTLSHPRLSVLDEQNMLYELEKSKEEILNQLGPEHTFSAECPFGTENERVMSYAHKIYPALRNRMPESFLQEYNRASKETPGNSIGKEYIQWQRGPLQKTTLELMKSWVDTLLVHDNVWLVLTFHGVDGVGWEAKPHEELKAYFTYLKDHEKDLWIVPFRDGAKYMRERMNSRVVVTTSPEKIVVSLKHSLDPDMYKLPLTLRTNVPASWNSVTVMQGEASKEVTKVSDTTGDYVLYQALPNTTDITITPKSGT